MKKIKSLVTKPVFLLAAAAILLVASTVGSTQAALTYYSENYTAEVDLSSIGVSLLEKNDEDGAYNVISQRNYKGNGEWHETTGTLLENMVPTDEKFTLGKTYDEMLAVKNSGSIDSFVRVIITKSWTHEEVEKDGNASIVKDPTLSPNLIELGVLLGDNNWVLDTDASTPERLVLYYTEVLEPAETDKDGNITNADKCITTDFTKTLRINPSVQTSVTETVVKDDATGKTIRYEFVFDEHRFNLDVEVDAVQTHNAEEAIKSAWGIDVTVDAYDEDGNAQSYTLGSVQE